MQHAKVFLAATVLYIGLLGCAGPDSKNTTQDDINFLRQKPSDGYSMTALLKGQLVLKERCLYIQSENLADHAAIWPSGYSLSVQEGNVQLIDSDKAVVAQVGDQIQVGGGEIPQLPPAEFAANFEGSATQCAAPYWIAAPDVEVIKP